MSALAEISRPDRLTSAASGPISGDVSVPGDKSISHRALIFGGVARGTTTISGLLEGEDVLRTANAIRAFGGKVERLGPGKWHVEGSEWHSPGSAIDCGNSGTCARLLMGAVAGFPIEAAFVGDASLSRRPMERILEPLRRMGARTEGRTLPVHVRGGGLNGISFINSPSSAQVKSAILLAGLRAEGEVEIIEPAPTRDHSENMLRAFGCDVEQKDGRTRLGANRVLAATHVDVPGDPSSAAFPIVAALIVPGSEVKINGVMVNPLRAGLYETLREMGADLKQENVRTSGGELIADITVRSSRLSPVEVSAERAPSMIDEYPALAIAAAFASGRSVMHGLAELRVKESDRLAAIISGLRASGVKARADKDSLIVEGRDEPPLGGAEILAHHDHRIAMSFLILGLVARKPITVDSAAMIGTSFPDFTRLMRGLGAHIQ